MTGITQNDYAWAQDTLDKGYAVTRLEWPRSRFLATTYLLTDEQADALAEAFEAAAEKGLEVPQNLPVQDYTEVVSLIDQHDIEASVSNWVAAPEDVRAQDWVLLDDLNEEEQLQ